MCGKAGAISQSRGEHTRVELFQGCPVDWQISRHVRIPSHVVGSLICLLVSAFEHLCGVSGYLRERAAFVSDHGTAHKSDVANPSRV